MKQVGRLALLPASAGFLLGLVFNPEDGGDMCLQNVCWLLTDYTALYPRWQNSSKPLLTDSQILHSAVGTLQCSNFLYSGWWVSSSGVSLSQGNELVILGLRVCVLLISYKIYITGLWEGNDWTEETSGRRRQTWSLEWSWDWWVTSRFFMYNKGLFKLRDLDTLLLILIVHLCDGSKVTYM